MKIGEYEQMMSYLTRPTTQTRENFAEAGFAKGRFSKDTNKGKLRELSLIHISEPTRPY